MEFLCSSEAFIYEWNFATIEITNQVRRETTKNGKKPTINRILNANASGSTGTKMRADTFF